ncbi:alpha/beta hydrolase [Nocardioides aurantiacus]|uniref:Acetyl esterase n=1 Tax=Nocardioides aurantiacus TaxID=86796 RepID=A0A3N2CYB0_9ACTN|nr:alpha/beta hydrolase [Nocardioides aurantiacus]ROR92517.1 acetyl esterase [Nocardioides aurantiacus]
MPVDPQLAGLLSLIEGGTPMHQTDPVTARTAFRTLAVDFRKPEDVVPVASVSETEVAGGDGPRAARVYRPEGDGPWPVVALFHGGGFVIGDLDTHDNLARRICRDASAVVVSVDYRLAPEHPFPAGLEDALAATRDLQQRTEELGGDGRVAVAGDSAGGNFAAVVSQHVPGLAAQLLIYPATDGGGDYPSRTENGEGYFLDLPTMLWFMEHYAPQDPADPRFSPIHGPLEGLPPAVVVTAELDPLRDEGEAYAAALTAAGVGVDVQRYDGMIHGFVDMGPFSAAAEQATADTVARFAAVLGSTAG